MKTYKYILSIFLLLMLQSCEKEWLEVRRDKQQVIPQKLEDYQALLDNVSTMNQWTTPSLGEVGSDDYYVTQTDWANLASIGPMQQKNAYVWAEEIFDTENSGSAWDDPYTMVYYANVALEGVRAMDVPSSRQIEADRIEGSALFYRSWAFYQLAQLFCKQYIHATAATDLGIPLRLESDINIPSVRASLQETYDRMVKDIHQAIPLLPDMPEEKIRPSKAAGYAFLARVQLQMGNYEAANQAAAQALDITDQLMDYNTLEPQADYPIAKLNEETLFYTTMVGMSAGILLESKLIVAPELYQLYEENDLRKSIFYYRDEQSIRYKGSYSNAEYFGMYMFGGLANDEVYLVKAECLTRLGEKEKAAGILNRLLEKRYQQGAFEPLEADDSLLDNIIIERRKELVFRGIRWSDLKRLNNEPRYAKMLTRKVGDEIFTLRPSSPRYVLPIPSRVIAITGMKQNIR